LIVAGKIAADDYFSIALERHRINGRALINPCSRIETVINVASGRQLGHTRSVVETILCKVTGQDHLAVAAERENIGSCSRIDSRLRTIGRIDVTTRVQPGNAIADGRIGPESEIAAREDLSVA